jgi:hypothetical protein
MEESIRSRAPGVQDVVVALLRMDPADRQPFIRPLIYLTMRVAADGGPTSDPRTPASGDLHPHS